MLAGIRDILITSTPKDLSRFRDLLDDGSAWGIEFLYAEQPNPDGVPQAFLIAKAFLAGSPAALSLGDNLFYENDITVSMRRAASCDAGGAIFAYRVVDSKRYRVVVQELGSDSKVSITALIEKPEKPPSAFAVTGLYFFDDHMADIANML